MLFLLFEGLLCEVLRPTAARLQHFPLALSFFPLKLLAAGLLAVAGVAVAVADLSSPAFSRFLSLDPPVLDVLARSREALSSLPS